MKMKSTTMKECWL